MDPGGSKQLPDDVLSHLLTLVDSGDWFKLIQLSRSCYTLCRTSTNYIYKAWKPSLGGPGFSSLHSLAVSTELFKLYVIISEGESFPPDAVDERHRTLLDLCVEMRYYEFSKFLVSQGYKSCIDADTMFKCIREHDIQGASILLSCGVPVNRFRSREDGLDVLTCSVLFGNVALVKLFVSRGVSVPSSILVEAIQARGSDPSVVEIVKTLVGHCDVNASASIGGVPLVHVTVLSSVYALQLLEVLFLKGADMNKRDFSEGGGLTVLDVADRKRRKNCCMFLERNGGRHSLRYAVETGNVGLIESLLKSTNNLPEMQYLVCLAAAMGQYASIRTLLEQASVGKVSEIQTRQGMTPLHLGACRGHRSICRLLLHAGANASAKVHGGIDLHIQAAVLSASPIWYNPADEGPNGTILPPPVRLKTAAELARESGYANVGKMIDLFVIESEMVRRESEDCSSPEVVAASAH